MPTDLFSSSLLGLFTTLAVWFCVLSVDAFVLFCCWILFCLQHRAGCSADSNVSDIAYVVSSRTQTPINQPVIRIHHGHYTKPKLVTARTGDLRVVNNATLPMTAGTTAT